jgi:LacI family transcriptional regulator
MVQIKDVAEAAGVSLSTVSRVVNRPHLVKFETREMVYDAIRQVGYTPPRKEAASRSYMIGLAIPDINIDFVGELIREIETQLDKTQYDLVLFNMKRKRQVSRYFRENAAFKKKIDALVILSATLDDECVDFFRVRNIPVVLLQSRCKREKSISTNNYLGAFDCVQFMIGRGYRTIAFIGWHPEDDHLLDRFNGYRNALEKGGLEYSPFLTSYGTLSRAGGYAATEELFSRSRPEAVFYACDSMAAGGYQFFKESKIRVPEDVGLTGFDNLEIAEILGLTTMKQFFQSKVELAVSYLLDRLSGKIKEPVAEEICINPRLVIRSSTR